MLTNPSTSNISVVILLTVCYTNSHGVNWENLVLDQLIIPQLIIFYILIICLLDIVSIDIVQRNSVLVPYES